MIIYVAGPFRGATPWNVEQNIRAAEYAGLQIALRGHTPLIPHSMYRFFDRSMPDRFWIDATRQLLECCDAIYLMPRWTDSQGAQGEKARAEELKLDVFYDLEEIEPLR